MSYDRAYSDERKAWKKSTKERGYESSDLEIDDVNDLNKIYCEVCRNSKKKNAITPSRLKLFLLIAHFSLCLINCLTVSERYQRLQVHVQHGLRICFLQIRRTGKQNDV